MPKSIARTWLEVVNVRVEKVQEITEEDAIAEGIEPVRVSGSTNYRDEQDYYVACGIATIEEFITLWDSINAKRGYAWDSNPWVRVVEFKRI